MLLLPSEQRAIDNARELGLTPVADGEGKWMVTCVNGDCRLQHYLPFHRVTRVGTSSYRCDCRHSRSARALVTVCHHVGAVLAQQVQRAEIVGSPLLDWR